MSSFVVEGGRPFRGEITVGGAKNLALKAIAASILSSEAMELERVPELEDIKRQLEILRGLGASVSRLKTGSYRITTSGLHTGKLDPGLVHKLRASAVLTGPLLARFGEVTLPHPGGCKIGRRPIDIFVRGLEALGAEVEEGPDQYVLRARGLRGGRFVFRTVSVTVTETLMLAATLASGTTTLINAAIEPEIPYLADYLNRHGAKISGAGTPFITIKGVKEIGAGKLVMMPDRIEAGSFAILAAATKSHLKVMNCEPQHLAVPLAVLKEVGVEVSVNDDTIEVQGSQTLLPFQLTTHEYPGFPTDLQPAMTVLLTQAQGSSLVHETIFEGRLFFTDTLNQMGADVTLCDPHRAIVRGPTPLDGRTIDSPDARAGLALLIAALAARGTSTINNIYQIDRGYERIEERLKSVGAQIERRK